MSAHHDQAGTVDGKLTTLKVYNFEVPFADRKIVSI